MSGTDIQRLADLFHEARRRRGDERSAFLDEACGDDSAVREQIEELLAEGDDPFPITDIVSGAIRETTLDPARSTARETETPERIGGCTVRGVLAEGGMGIVYEGEQENPRRTVAIKVMRSGITSADALKRFEYEAFLLAHLHHPGIAQVYEAGTQADTPTAFGHVDLPYIVMELVSDARPITTFAKEERPSTRELLGLFARVCDAVQYAHQKGVIHRDLKPANVLVDAERAPKIIDFGVAHPTTEELAASVLLTREGQLIGTLQYMSPEQCRGHLGDLDTRSDVYSLGVLLFELLCGRVPYEVDDLAPIDAAEVVCERRPQRPSTIDGRLAGELEAIVLKALEKERSRRYQSAGEIAADIRRHLSGEGVLARRASAAYQLRVFARRNKGLVAGVAVAVVALAIGVTSTVLAREEAELQRDEATGILRVLSTTLRNADFQFIGVQRMEVLDTIALALEDEALFRRPTLAEAEVRMLLGVAYLNAQQNVTAAVHLERALTLYEQLEGEAHLDSIAARYHLANSIHDSRKLDLHRKNWELSQAEPTLRSVELAGSLRMYASMSSPRSRRVTTDAYEPYEGALAMIQDLPDSPSRAWEEARILNAMGMSSTELVDRLRFHREARAICVEQGVGNRGVFDSTGYLASTLVDKLRGLDATPGELHEVVELCRNRAEIARNMFGEDPMVVGALAKLGTAELAAGDPRAAAGTFGEALALQRTLNPDGDPGRTLGLLLDEARALRAAGELDEARDRQAECDEALALLDERYADDPKMRMRIRREMDGTSWDLAWQGFEIWREELEAEDERAGWVLGHWAAELMRVGSFDESETMYGEAFEALRETGAPSADVLFHEILYAQLRFYRDGRLPLDELDSLHERAFQEEAFNTSQTEGWTTIVRMKGLSLAREGLLEDAEDLLVESASYDVWPGFRNRGISRWALARVLREQGLYEEAWTELRSASWRIAIRGTAWQSALVECEAARVQAELGDHEWARELFDAAFPVLRETLGEENLFVREALEVWEARPRPKQH